ncbi:RHS repeat-associated core domain-containing protein [Pseudobacteroides cellulosolvens]|nr:RHS repeat-associated core domain-containing protein [Pseudobacteroides cellulosolvens]
MSIIQAFYVSIKLDVLQYQYDAFGNTVEAVEKVQNRFRYAGEQFDSVTGQYYLSTRFYNPVVGRFTQEHLQKRRNESLFICSK